MTTYFRPRPPLAEGEHRNNTNSDAEVLGEVGTAGGAGDNAAPVAVAKEEGGRGGGEKIASDGQKWELFEDAGSDHTARFRGRKFM